MPAGSGQFTIRIEGTEELQQKLHNMSEVAKKETSNTVKKATLKAEATAKEELKFGRGFRKGHLRRSIHHLFVGAFKGIVGTNVSYAPYIEFGTKPHIITPKGSVLVFNVGGVTIFTRSVNHPGTKAIKMFKKGADAAFKLIKDKLGDMVTKIEHA